MARRPNVLWLTYEDTSPQFVSCYGMTQTTTTPNIDALARDGVRFDNVFATAPVCSASRSALITGVCNEASGLGHHRSKYPVPRSLIKGFPWYLQQSGYYTTNNAKTDYNIVDESDFIRETWNESSNTAHWRNRGDDQPFFSVFNYMDSHQSRTMTKPWTWYENNVLGQLGPDDTVDPTEIVVPPIYRDTPEMRRHLTRVHNSLRLCDRRIQEQLDELHADGLADDTIVFCFADHGEGIPRGKCNGIGFGYRAAFVVWFPEKLRHLSPWGCGSVTSELVSFEDLAPTVLSLAGVSVPDYMSGRPILGAQRERPRRYVFAARNRLDDTPDLCRSAMDGRFVYTRNYFPHLPVVKYQKYSDVGDILRCIRRDFAAGELDEIQAEMVAARRPREYLYDLTADPWEIVNLSENPLYADDLSRMRQATIDHALETHDVMFLPERDMVQRAGERTPYELRANDEYNPLLQLMEAADLVGQPDATGRQIDLLSSPDDAVRYWAAVGIFADWAMLGDSTGEVRRLLAEEPAIAVRIELAAALAAPGDDAESVEVLSSGIGCSDALLAHQAMCKVLYMPQSAPLFEDAVSTARARWLASGDDASSYPVRQAIEMYRYLYCDEPLYFSEDAPYLNPDEQRRDW